MRSLGDRAEGERFRIAVGTSAKVLGEQRATAPKEAVVVVSNANAFAVKLNVSIGTPGQKIEAGGDSLTQVDGIATW